MRTLSGSTTGLILAAFLLGCGGDSNEPEPPFPDAAGVYEMSGGFDDIPSADGSFTGTLELTQASRESGALAGSAAILVDLGGDVFNITDDDLGGATVSPSGTVTFTLGDLGATWTFTGTLTASAITAGRHTLSGDVSISGDWRADRTAGAGVALLPGRSGTIAELVGRLGR